jgi:ABC-2 type transport system permease protein
MILQALFFVFLAKAAGGNVLARFALIGNGVQIAVFFVLQAMWEVFENEKWNGTLQFLIAAPANWLPMMLGKCMASYGDALVSTILTFAVLVPALQVPIDLIHLLRAVPLILLTIASASALGWLVGAISLSIRWGHIVCNMLGYLMIALCGINFPFSALPPAVQGLGILLPVTHGLLAVRAVIDGASYAAVMPLIGMEVLIGCGYAALAWLTFGWRLRTTRQRGTFEQI